MTRKDDKAEIQHYVPKMLLKRFAIPRERGELQVHVFDKLESRTFRTSIGNIAAEREYYNFEHSRGKISIESSLSKLEDRADYAFGNILEHESLRDLSEENRGWIRIFIATQQLRTPHFRQLLQDVDAGIKRKVERMGHDPEEVEEWKSIGDENELKLQANAFLFQSIQEFAACLKDKDVILLKTGLEHPFWISDNPVTMHNDNDFRPFGNIGLRVPGIQIYLPLSPTITLGFWCPTIANESSTVRDEAEKLRKHLLVAQTLGRNVDQIGLANQIAELDGCLETLAPIRTALQEGTPVLCKEENVTFLNSLQVQSSNRFVISQIASFDLAEQMISDNAEHRSGFRITIG